MPMSYAQRSAQLPVIGVPAASADLRLATMAATCDKSEFRQSGTFRYLGIDRASDSATKDIAMIQIVNSRR